MILLDGKVLAEKIRCEMREEVQELRKTGINPNLGVILVGDFAPSVIYVRNKENACADVGIITNTLKLNEDITEDELINIITDWNQNQTINGILVQMPLPKHIEHQKVLDTINPQKDVDGLSVYNLGRLLSGQPPFFYPCTPLGIVEILKRYNIRIEGKHCVIIGRGELVGKPLTNMLLSKGEMGNATVTVCHSRTQDIEKYTRQADILIVAIGQAHFLKKDMIKDGAIVVDVGVNRININEKKTKLVGDVEFDTVKDIVLAITPVPGGVGPMTVTMLLKNTIQAAKYQK